MGNIKKQSRKEYIILVNPADKELGTEEKMLVHKYAMLHRAFSVFIFRKRNKKIELLLQQRKEDKYHSGGLWTNTCCGHLHAGEKIKPAAEKRLQHEMGLAIKLKEVGTFHYVAAFKNGLYENEIDHVFIGQSEQDDIGINKDEVANFSWINISSLKKDLSRRPNKYTPWFIQALQLAYLHIKLISK